MDGDGFQLERDAAVATGASAFANLLCDVVRWFFIVKPRQREYVPRRSCGSGMSPASGSAKPVLIGPPQYPL
jgi:hypothetical protein